jgi:hypothetical protein
LTLPGKFLPGNLKPDARFQGMDFRGEIGEAGRIIPPASEEERGSADDQTADPLSVSGPAG